MKVGFDIDGVLADFGNHFLNYLRFEDKSPPKEWNDSRFKNNFESIEDDALFWETIPAIPNSHLIRHLFLSKEIICYCTARPLSMTEITKEWLWRNGFPYAEVINVGLDGKKSTYLKGKVDFFIDDGFHNYEDLNNNNIICYLMSRSHNENIVIDKRVNDLTEFKNKIDRI